MNYEIIVIDVDHVRVFKDSVVGRPIIEDFFGKTCKSDSIRWIKRVGGRSATFNFVDMKEIA